MRLVRIARCLDFVEQYFTTLDIVKEEESNSTQGYKPIAENSTLFIRHPTTEQLLGRKLKEKGEYYGMYSYALQRWKANTKAYYNYLQMATNIAYGEVYKQLRQTSVQLP